MQETILKAQWEKTKSPVNMSNELIKTLIAPFTTDEISSTQLMASGLRNANYKISFKSTLPPILLRVYLADKTALQREIALHHFIGNKVPVPKHIFHNEECKLLPYPYAIMEFINGKIMRDVIFTKEEEAISACTFEAGKYLSLLRETHLPFSGFFKPNLEIIPFKPHEDYLAFITSLLASEVIKEKLGDELTKSLSQLFINYAGLIPELNQANLTHADFDPTNMLVKEIHGHFKITAILDWEFAFAGTYLIDMGTMLRFSHKLPRCYEKSFIEGIETYTQNLGKDWRKQVKLIDLLSLLQLLNDKPLNTYPKLNHDVIDLIKKTIQNFPAF